MRPPACAGIAASHSPQWHVEYASRIRGGARDKGNTDRNTTVPQYGSVVRWQVRDASRGESNRIEQYERDTAAKSVQRD